MRSTISDRVELAKLCRSTISDRVELAKLCSSRDWSKAIRILDSLLSQSCAIQDICNRAFCYSQLELHKHVIKDCDKALQLDPKLPQGFVRRNHRLAGITSCLCQEDQQLLEYVVLLGLFLAANMEVTESIPQGLQVDWEVILTSDPSSFVDSMKHLL